MATNTLGLYNPIFYANEALSHLRNALGMAARIYRGYDQERRSVNEGEVISIRRPATFEAKPAPSVAQDLRTGSVNIVLDGWWEVKYEITDKEMAWTDERIITEHIGPAAYAIANKIDEDLASLYYQIPWLYDYGTATDHTIITGAYQVAFNNGVPMMDDGNVHMMVDGLGQMYFHNSAVFHNAATVGINPTPTLMRGTLGTRFGVEVFANQNTPTHTNGTGVTNDAVGALSADVAKYATSFPMNALGVGTILPGDTFVIAGHTQRYAVTAPVTIAGNAATVIATPEAAMDYPSGSVVTFTQQTAGAAQFLLYHRDAFALAFAPLPMDLPGIQVFTAVDPVSGISLRARRFVDANNSKQYVALDALWGKAVLNNNLAVRAWT